MRARKVLTPIVLFLLLAIALCVAREDPPMTRELPPSTDEQSALRAELARDLQVLAGDIGPRSLWHPAALAEAADFIQHEWRAAGYDVRRQAFTARGRELHNLEIELPGGAAADEVVVIGAHYDTVAAGCPGANDNGTGVVALLALARRFAGFRPSRTLRFVAFVNEEPPFFQTDEMGSVHYARRCKQRGERIVAMLCLETMGYFSDEPGSQRYPPVVGWFYPSRGDFIAFVGNLGSRKLVRHCTQAFRRHGALPAESAALPGWVPGVGWSDHWSFWQQGYPGVMVTDTAPFRYPHYHTADDTPDAVDTERLARVVDGLRQVALELVGGP